MRYCLGSCRKKHYNELNNCSYYKVYTLDIENNDNKIHEICAKKNFFVNLFWKIFFSDLIELNNYNIGNRKSDLVSFNRESYLKNRDL